MAWTTINRLLFIWKSDLSPPNKTRFLSSCVCVNSTVWMHHMDVDKMYKKIARQKQHKHCMKQQLYGHLRPISKTSKVRQTRHLGCCWRSKGKLTSDIFLWTPTH